MMTKLIQYYFDNFNKVLSIIDKDSIQKAIDLVKSKIKEDKKIITCGNGGSALTASHYINDWNKSYNLATGGKLKGISLCDNTGLVTAYANDLSYEEIFSGQLKNIGDRDDLLIVVSGSGNSKNVLKAIELSKEIGVETLSFVGYDGGECIKISDYSVHIPSFDMQICEDIHLILGHLIMKSICNKEI